MGIVVHHLLYLEGRTFLLHFHGQDNVEVLGLCRRLLVPHPIGVELGVIRILHIVACVTAVGFDVDTTFHKVGIEVIEQVILALQVDHGACLALL